MNDRVHNSFNKSLNISVVMATYNGAKYILEQLHSIFEQTLAPDEVIIVDDCSTDNTLDIVREYARYYPQIKLYRNKSNLGVIKTFEFALTLCTGQFIALADQDDYWLSNKLELLIKNIGNNWLIHSDACIVDESLNVINESYKRIKPYHDNSLTMYFLRNNVTGCTVLLHQNLLKLALPFPPSVIMHDHYLALCAKHYDKLSYLDQPLIKYRQHSQNLIGSGEYQSYLAMISNYRQYVLFLDGLKFAKIQFNHVYLRCASGYFTAIVDAKMPQFATVKMVNQLFGLKNVVVLFLYTLFGRTFAKFIFNRKKNNFRW